MLTIFRDPNGALQKSQHGSLPKEVIWLDLLNPTGDEKSFVETSVGIRVPSIEALSEIESSSRLIFDCGVIYLSMPLVAQGDSPDPFVSPAGFILSSTVLVTVRFTDLPIFKAVAEKVRHDETLRSGGDIFVALMETLVDRGADVLERLGGELDRISRAVFRGDPSKLGHTVRSNNALRRTLTDVGEIGNRLSQSKSVFLGCRSNDPIRS